MKPANLKKSILTVSTVLAVLLGFSHAVFAASATWNGTTDATWAGTGNWSATPVPGTGDTATFNNAGNANTTLDLGAGVTISNVLFDTASVATYTIGLGAVGSQTLTLNGSGSVGLTATVAGNQLFNANLSLGTTAGNDAFTFTNASSAALTLAGGLTCGTSGTKSLTVAGSGNTTISGNITDGVGSLGIIKTGTGALTIGSYTTAAGAVNLNGGKLNVTSGATTLGTGAFTLGSGSTAATLALSGGASLTSAVGFFNNGNGTSGQGIFNIASGSSLIVSGNNGGNFGASTTSSGILYNKGNFLVSQVLANNSGIYLGNSTTSYGYIFNTGTATVSARMWSGQGSGAVGVVDIPSGQVLVGGTNQGTPLQFSFNGGTTASAAGLNITGGSLTQGVANNQVAIGSGQNVYTSINVWGAGSLMHLNGDSGFDIVSSAPTAGNTNITTITVGNGGEIDFAYLYKNAFTATGTFNFNGGTVMATAADGNGLFILGGTAPGGQGPATVLMQSGGGTINLNGFNPRINVPLLAPTGNGVTGITLGGTLTGYIGNPLVKILGGGGIGAAAYTQFDPTTGTITNMVITSPGSGYTSAPTVTLVGGGGTIGAGANASTATATATIGPVSSGGLTVTGSGILTMSLAGGPNTYTGPTVVLNGSTLPITPSTFANPTPLVISNATVNLDSTSQTPLNLTNETYQNNAVLNISYGALTGNPTWAAINDLGSLAVPGSNVTINLSATGATGLSAGDFTLIKYAGTPLTAANFTNFVLGTLPSGLGATLSNNTANLSIDLNVSFIAPTLTWYGQTSSNWDINITPNWNTGTATYNEFAGPPVFGNPVIFDDSLYTGGPNPPNYNVNLATNVHSALVTFNSAASYSLTGSGTIGGAGLLELNGSGTVTIGTSNSFTGGVHLNAGTLIISNDNALGASSGLLTINGGALEIASNTVSTRPILFNTTPDFIVPSGATGTINGAVTVPGNTQGVTKDGGGTLALGSTIAILQPLTVNAGTAQITGSLTESIFNTISIVVGTAGQTGTILVSGGGRLTSINASSFVRLGGTGGVPAVGIINNTSTANPGVNLSGNGVGFGAGAAGGIGAIYNSGTINLVPNGGAAAMYMGNLDGSYGYIRNAKTINLTAAAALDVGFNNNSSGSGGIGVFDQIAGATTTISTAPTFAINNSARVYSGSPGVAQVNVMGGSLILSAAGTVPINNGGNLYSSFNITSNSVVTGPAGTGIELNTSSAANNTSTLTLHSGGILQATFIDEPAGSLSTGVLNFNGGILRATAADATALVRSPVTAYVQSGGAIIDSSNFNVTVASSLLAPQGDGSSTFGVTSIALTGTTTNYAGAPAVEITGGGGSGAAAMAIFNPATGTVTGVTMTSPGSGYTSAPTVTLVGGGGDGTLTGTPTMGAISSGGLTKIGTGTLTLIGTNTYSGGTVVSNGEVTVTQAHQVTGSLSVSNGAAFGVSLKAAGTANIGALTLGTAATDNTFLDFAVGNFTNTTLPLLQAGALTLNGTNIVRIAGRIIVRTFPLLKYTGTMLGTGQFATNVVGPQGSVVQLSNNVASSTLYAVVTSTGPGLIWTGTNAIPAQTDVWGINTVTNWTINGLPTTYNQVFVPGDTVSFTDSGNPLVFLNTNVSPVSVTISNQIQNYTFQGSGGITGASSLTKFGSGTATLNLPNNIFTGGTVVSNGTLQLAQANALGAGDLSISPIGRVDLNGNNQTVNNLSLGGVVDNTSATASVLTMGGGASTITWTGSITNTGSGGTSFIENGDNGGTVTIGATNYLSNAATSQFNGDTLAITNNGALIFSGTAQYWIAGAVNSIATNIINGGSLVVSNDWLVVGRGTAAGTPSAANGTLIVNSGTVQKAGANNIVIGSLGATGTLIVNGGQVLNNADLWIGEAPGAVANFYLNGGLVQADVVRPNNNGGFPAVNNAYFNGGTLQATTNSTSYLQVICNVMSNGFVLDDGGFTLSINAAALLDGDGLGGGVVKKGAGTVYFDAPNSYTGMTVVTNGTLAGIGSVNGPVTVGPAGNLGSGDTNGISPATPFTIAGNLILHGNATLRIDKTGGTLQPPDQIAVGGTATYGGTLTITNITADGSPLAVGDTVTLFIAGGYNGSFAAIQNAPFIPGLAWSNDVANPGNFIVIVNTAVPPVAGFGGSPTNLFVTQSVLFTNSSTGSFTSAAWTFGDGNVANLSGGSVSNNVSDTYSNAGTYNVRLIVSGAGGSSTNTQTAYITVYPKVAISKPVLIGGSLVLSSATGGVPGAQYRILSTNTLPNTGSTVVWPTVFTGTFDQFGGYSYTITPLTNTASFFRLVSP